MMQAKEELKRVNDWMKTFGENSPDSMKSFQNLIGSVEKEGVLSAKTKELMAIAISITQQCEWCIAYHVNNAINKEGATSDEVIEAAWVAVLMGGGPALMHAGLVLEALEDLKK